MFKSLRKVLFQVQSHTDNRTSLPPEATRGSLISDLSRVNQYRHVISEDIKMDILPLEQDITDVAQDAEVVKVNTFPVTTVNSSNMNFSRRSSELCWC